MNKQPQAASRVIGQGKWHDAVDVPHTQMEQELFMRARIVLPVAEPMDCCTMALSAQPREEAGTQDARLPKATAAIEDKQRLAAQAKM